MLKKIALVVGAVIALIVVVGVARGRDWHVERATTINARPETIQPLLIDFEKGWTQWSVWASMDPAAKWEFGGAAGTVGHSMRWSGQKIGGGTLKLEAIEPLKVVYRGVLDGKEDQGDTGTITLTADGTSTKVLWTDDGVAPPVVGGLLKGMLQKSLGAQFEKNLEQLKALAEKTQANNDAAAKAAADKAAADAAATPPAPVGNPPPPPSSVSPSPSSP